MVRLSVDDDRGHDTGGHGEGEQHADRLPGDQDGLVDPDAGEVVVLLVRDFLRLGHVGQHEHATGFHGSIRRSSISLGIDAMDSQGVGESQGTDQAHPGPSHVEQPPPVVNDAGGGGGRRQRASSFEISHEVSRIKLNPDWVNNLTSRLRYGSDNGVACYTFQLATKSLHTAWLSSLVQGTLASARNQGQVKAVCTYKGQDCTLSVHIDLGFILAEKLSGQEIWNQPFHNLCASNDDGAKLLW